MNPAPDVVTITLPRAVLNDALALSDNLIDPMHELLERNTDGALSANEVRELEALVALAELGQILRAACAVA